MRLAYKGGLIGKQVRLWNLLADSSCLVWVDLRLSNLNIRGAGRTILNSHLLVHSLRQVDHISWRPHLSNVYVADLVDNSSALYGLRLWRLLWDRLRLLQIVRKLLLVGWWSLRSILIRVVHCCLKLIFHFHSHMLLQRSSRCVESAFLELIYKFQNFTCFFIHL